MDSGALRGLHNARVWRGQCHRSLGQGARLRQLPPGPVRRGLHSRGAAQATLRPTAERSRGNSVPAAGLDEPPAPPPSTHLILLTGERCAPSASEVQGSSDGRGGSSSSARQEVITSVLRWGEPVALPPEWNAAVTAAAAGAAGTPRQGSKGEVSLTVWLSSPDGPAAVRLGSKELQELCRGETLSARATPLQQLQGSQATRPPLVLMCCMRSRDVPVAQPPRQSLRTQEAPEFPGVLTGASQARSKPYAAAAQQPAWWCGLSDAVQVRLASAAGLGLVALTSWAALLIPGGSSQAVQIIKLVDFLLLSGGAVAGFILLAYIRLDAPTRPSAAQPQQNTTQEWSLTLLGVRRAAADDLETLDAQ